MEKKLFGSTALKLFINAYYGDKINKVTIYFDDVFMISFNPHINGLANINRLDDRYRDAAITVKNLGTHGSEFIIWLQSHGEDWYGCKLDAQVKDIIEIFKEGWTFAIIYPDDYKVEESMEEAVNYIAIDTNSIGIALY